MVQTVFQQDSIYIIAEAGVNHNGDVAIAMRLIDVAAKAGADAVKFQLFDPEEITSPGAPLAEYQKRSGETSQIDMLKALTLTRDEYKSLAAHADERNIDFIVTPFDAESAKFLKTLPVPALKIPSGEITNLPFLREVAALHLPVILSTGTSDLEEVTEAVQVFRNAGTELSILHCTSSYPTPMEQVNLRAMQTLADTFGVPTGLSDHTEGIEVAIAAAALGARIIEKHFTLDRTASGPDHAASIEPDELAALVRAIRNVQSALGTGKKVRQSCEENTAAVARRSIHVVSDLQANETITARHVALKRPGTGISPKELHAIIGKTAVRDIAAGTLLTPDMFV